MSQHTMNLSFLSNARIAIVGSRHYQHFQIVRDLVQVIPLDCVVVSGGAYGVDTIAAVAATSCGLEVKIHEAEWLKYGKSAGYRRNEHIVIDSDLVVAFWDEESNGTLDTISWAHRYKRSLLVFGADGTLIKCSGSGIHHGT